MNPKRQSPKTASTRAITWLAALLSSSGLAFLARDAAAVTHLEHGVIPPPVVLDTLAGARVSLEDSRGRPTVVVFGELYHQRTLQAFASIREVLESDDLEGDEITVLLVIAHDAPSEELDRKAKELRLPATVLHDVQRKAYGAYRVAVLPSAVVIDGQGRVVHTLAGYGARFQDTLGDALQLATGRLDLEQFVARLHPEPREVDDARVRAARVTSLAGQLVHRGLDDVAEEKYREALALEPAHVPARLGLAMVLLKKQQLAGAEEQFKLALAGDPGSVEASLGLAWIRILRGGEELQEAEHLVRRLLADNPDEPRGHYLLGLIHQERDELADASAAFRKAAELLMNRRDAWHVIPGGPAP